MARRKRLPRIRITARRIRCKGGWHITLLRRGPSEQGGLEAGETIKILSINHKTKTIVAIPGSPPGHPHKDIYD